MASAPYSSHLAGVFESHSGIAYLFSNHVDSILDAAIWNDWEHRCVDDSQILDTMHLEVFIHNTLFNVRGKTSGSARVWVVSANVSNSKGDYEN
jgi:hypothetical protein